MVTDGAVRRANRVGDYDDAERTAFDVSAKIARPMRTVIVGAGTMGVWFAETTSGWLEPTFVDTNSNRATTAADEMGGESASAADVKPAPIVCTAVPLSITPKVIGEYASFAEQAVIDLSGAMQAPLDAMRSHAPECEHISLHPLFAPANAPGNIATVSDQGGSISELLHEALTAAGNHVFETSATEHDRAMETIQAKVHAAVIAYALAAEPVDEQFHTPVSAEMASLARTVLTGSPRVYADIQSTFDGATDLATAAAAIAEADHEGVEQLYREAASDYREYRRPSE